MIIIPLVFVLSLFTLAISDKAPKIKKNPKDVVAIADFPFGGDKNVKGNVVFTAKQGKHVNVHIDMTGFPKNEGPFLYHIHDRSVPGDGNCEAVGLHFNPYNASPNCNEQKHDGYCQVGDLSGKHGLINTTCFELKYTDPYLSLNKKSKSYIIGKSIVFHFSNMTKIACADIEEANDLRLQSLIDEYTQSDDSIQLKELKTPIEKDYKFDELEALSAEVYESDPAQEVISSDKLYNKSDNVYNEGDSKKHHLQSLLPLSKWKKSNTKNYSNISIHGISSECPNKGMMITNPLFGSAILGLLSGLLL
ncbi:SOD6 Cell surface superoxide dismutase [Cu-Zn] 6 [Candida maltosa Xu316]